MQKISYPIFDKVLFIGPDMRGKGGIASVLQSYSNNFTPFHYLGTNFRGNRVLGYLRTLTTAVRMPFARMKGRKIAHFHYCSGKSWHRKTLLMKWARLWGYKVVTHCHSAEMREFSRRYGYDKIRSVLDKAEANIVLSDSWAEFFENKIQCRNLFVVNNIVDRPIKHNDILKHQPITFLFLGQIGERKGIFDLLMAMAHIKNRGLDFRFIVGGNGEIKRFKEEVSRLGLNEVVDFRGWIDVKAKDNAFNDSDVLVLPSYNEGLPISILEAMAREKAVIATSVGGIPEILSDKINGRLVTPGNIEEITEVLESYILQPNFAVSHGKASASIIQRFYPEGVARQLADIYTSVLS